MRAQWVCSRERRIALYKRTSIKNRGNNPTENCDETKTRGSNPISEPDRTETGATTPTENQTRRKTELNVTKQRILDWQGQLVLAKKKDVEENDSVRGAGIKHQWLEHRTRDWKAAGNNPCWERRDEFSSPGSTFCADPYFGDPFHRLKQGQQPQQKTRRDQNRSSMSPNNHTRLKTGVRVLATKERCRGKWSETQTQSGNCTISEP